MKNTNKLFAILMMGTLLFSFTACSDMLKEETYGSPTTDDMLANEENVALLVGQAYADVKWLHDHWGYWGVNSLTSDECVCPIRTPGGHWNDGGYWKNLNNHNWNVFGDAFKNIWNTTISGAVLCNKLIYTLELNKANMSTQVYNQYVGELKALRSLYYYMLFDCFGRIPYKENFNEDAEPLMEPAMVWANLVRNLEESAKNLPPVNSDASRSVNYGRCTQGFAYALLARLYLNAPSYASFNQSGDFLTQLTTNSAAMDTLAKAGIVITSENDFYNNCCRCCEAVISSGSYEIAEDFFSNFAIKNESSKENIFVIVEEGSADFDYRDYAGSMANKLRVTMLSLHYCHQTTWGLIEKPWNGFCARPSFIALYNDEDVRGPGNEKDGTNDKNRWGWFLGPIYDKVGVDTLRDENKVKAVIRPEISSLDSATWNDGARMLKYEVDKSGTYKYCENDFVLFRYADILWMNEEAIKRGATTGSTHIGSAQFNTMLARVFANSTGSKDDRVAKFIAKYGDPAGWTTDQICNERGREFAWENMRRRDLIRNGKFEAVEYVKSDAKNPYRRWFPIPYAIREKAARGADGKSIWTQNYGYNDGIN